MNTHLRSCSIVAAISILLSAGSALGERKLSSHDQKLLTESRAKGETSVTLLIATAPGDAKAVANGITALGGSVRYRHEGLGYLRAQVPSANVEAIAALAGIEAVNLDEVLRIPNPKPEQTEDGIQVNPPDDSTTPLNPYMPTRDAGAAQFVAAHPQFDGRGVTIGVVDTGITLDHPALQTTTTGERKIIDWVRATDDRA